MPAGRVGVVLAMTKLSPTKRDLVSIIGAYEGGRWLTSADAAHELGLSDGTCRRLLLELARAKVILRDGGGGERIFWCEVNPDLSAWKVTWRLTVRQRLDRLARYDAEVSSGVGSRFIARPMHARCGAVIARLMSARSADVNPRDPGMEDLVGEIEAAATERASRAKQRAKRPGLSIVPDARDAPRGRTKGVGFSSRLPNASNPRDDSSSSEGETRHPDHVRVAAAIRDQVNANDKVRATTFGWTDSWRPSAYGPFGQWENLLDELLHDFGTAKVLSAITRVSVEVVKVPAFLQQMRLELMAGLADEDAGRELEIATTRRKRDALVAILETFDSVPGRLPRPEDDDRKRELIAQIAACNARLAELGAAA